MHSLGLRLLLTYHRIQLWLRHLASCWELGDLPCVALGAVLVFGVTILISAFSGMSLTAALLWSFTGLLMTGSWLLHALCCLSTGDLEERIASIRVALVVAAAPPIIEPVAAIALPCPAAPLLKDNAFELPLAQAPLASQPVAVLYEASVPSAPPIQVSTERDSLASFLNSSHAVQRKTLVTQHSNRGSDALVGCFAFVLCVPIGVTIAVIISMSLFPQANGAAPTGLAVFCCWVTYQLLAGMFGGK